MGEGPLQKYFLGEKMHGAGADIFTANMYLAEDRVRTSPPSFGWSSIAHRLLPSRSSAGNSSLNAVDNGSCTM